MARRGAAPDKTGERISQYFDKEKLDLIVRRGELMAILDQLVKQITMPWYVKAWRRLQMYYVRSATAPMAEEEKS